MLTVNDVSAVGIGGAPEPSTWVRTTRSCVVFPSITHICEIDQGRLSASKQETKFKYI